MKNNLFELLEKAGFEGCDTSLEISLCEYGLVTLDRPDNNDVYYIAVYQWDENNDPLVLDHGSISYEDIDRLTIEEWFNRQSFLSYTGMSEKDYKDVSYPVKLSDMIRYWGVENILGCCYYAFHLTEDLREAQLSEYDTNYGCSWIGDIDILKPFKTL